MSKIGQRIGAVYKANHKTVYLLGFGVYAGDDIPPKDGGWIAETLHEAGVAVPKLVLDNDQIVWGYQCWWGSEERMLDMIGDREIEHVRMEDILKDAIQ